MQPSITMSKPARSGRWMLPVGIVLVIASIAVAAVAGAQSQRLSALVVSSPAPGMVATAIGNGGAAATQVEAAAKGLRPATGLGYVPTTPPIYLEPRQLTLNGRPDGTGPAYWKVWWDGQSQVKAGVSLQQSTTDAYERQGLAQLAQTTKGLYPNESPLSIPNVPGATGYRFTSAGSYEIMAALFGNGTNIAMVSMKSYGTATIDEATFLAFAASEYTALKTGSSKIAPALAAGFVVLLHRRHRADRHRDPDASPPTTRHACGGSARLALAHACIRSRRRVARPAADAAKRLPPARRLATATAGAFPPAARSARPDGLRPADRRVRAAGTGRPAGRASGRVATAAARLVPGPVRTGPAGSDALLGRQRLDVARIRPRRRPRATKPSRNPSDPRLTSGSPVGETADLGVQGRFAGSAGLL